MRSPTLRVATWNVGGIVGPVSLVRTLRDTVAAHRFDLLAMQEFPFSQDSDGALPEAALAIGLPCNYGWPLSASHRSNYERLGLAILSRYPIARSKKTVFPNEKSSVRRTYGEKWSDHDKGLLETTLLIDSQTMIFGTAHLPPFHRLGREGTDPEFAPVWEVLAQSMNSAAKYPSVFAGDFNTEHLSQLFRRHSVSDTFTVLINRATRPSGKKHDNIVCSSHWVHGGIHILPSASNHHICVADIALSKQY